MAIANNRKDTSQKIDSFNKNLLNYILIIQYQCDQRQSSCYIIVTVPMASAKINCTVLLLIALI